MPARSSASQLTSSSSRCCGSIASASRGEIPKNVRVELVDVAEEAALAAVRLARSRPDRGRTGRRTSQRGNGSIASPPRSSSAHSASGLVTPPGNRHAIDTIAIGSSAPATRDAGAGRGTSAHQEAGQRLRRGVIEQQRGRQRARPSRAASRLRISTAISESRPRSLSGRSAPELGQSRGRPRPRPHDLGHHGPPLLLGQRRQPVARESAPVPAPRRHEPAEHRRDRPPVRSDPMRRRARSSAIGADRTSPAASAASSSSMPCVDGVNAPIPWRLMRATSAAPRCPAIALGPAT